MELTQKVTQSDRAPKDRYLTGKGGVGLVMFHLAKLRIEFAVASDNCPFGDIWIHLAGQKIGIEVKTTRRGSDWHVRKSQLGSADFYCFVSMDNASIYVLPHSEVASLVRDAAKVYDGVALISDRALRRESLFDWGCLRGLPQNEAPRPKRRRYISTRTVKRVMANGETKIYMYPPAAPG